MSTVVERIILHAKKPAILPTASPTVSEPICKPVVRVMLATRGEDRSDGSNGLFTCCCRGVEHDLTDDAIIAAIREVEKSKPFPRHWSDGEIRQRIRDAEKKAERGAAKNSLWTQEGRTDSANARRLAARFGETIRWCDVWRRWLIWDGRRWVVDDRCAVEGFAKIVATELWQEAGADTGNKDAIRHARYSNSLAGIRNMVALARSEPGLTIRPAELDQDRFLLNLPKGTLDLRTGELRSHRREDFITKLAPFDFDARAGCPRWLRFLDTISANDSEWIAFLQRLCGYILTGDVSEQILAILFGTGANGKSVLLNVLLDILGDYAIKATENLLIEKIGNEHPTIFADLAGKRLAVATETGDGARLAENRIKELTGGDRIRARKMREDFSEFLPTHKTLLATNYKPRIRGTDLAIWRRIRLLPFEVTIAPAEQDRDLPNKLRAEYAGILAWMVAGCLAWQRDGLGVPKRIESATAAYRAEENTFGTFLAACCEVAADATIGASELFRAYQHFTGDRNITQRTLATMLVAQGFNNARVSRGPNKGRIAWHGVRLNGEGSEGSEPNLY